MHCSRSVPIHYTAGLEGGTITGSTGVVFFGRSRECVARASPRLDDITNNKCLYFSGRGVQVQNPVLAKYEASWDQHQYHSGDTHRNWSPRLVKSMIGALEDAEEGAGNFEPGRATGDAHTCTTRSFWVRPDAASIYP